MEAPGQMRKRMERCRKFGDVTRNGVVYDYELAGPHGAAYELFREPAHGDLDIEHAKAGLRSAHDVVSIRITAVSQAELDAPIPPDAIRTRPVPETEPRPFYSIRPNDVREQKIYFRDRFWQNASGDFPKLTPEDVGRRLVLEGSSLTLEGMEVFIDRLAGAADFPRGGDVVRLAAPWGWAGPTLRIGSLGFVDGAVREEYLISVQITFNSVPYVDDSYCSASGGPGTIATPIQELKATKDRIQVYCWMWKDRFARAHNGAEYLRTCRIWDWFPGE